MLRPRARRTPAWMRSESRSGRRCRVRPRVERLRLGSTLGPDRRPSSAFLGGRAKSVRKTAPIPGSVTMPITKVPSSLSRYFGPPSVLPVTRRRSQLPRFVGRESTTTRPGDVSHRPPSRDRDHPTITVGTRRKTRVAVRLGVGGRPDRRVRLTVGHRDTPAGSDRWLERGRRWRYCCRARRLCLGRMNWNMACKRLVFGSHVSGAATPGAFQRMPPAAVSET